MNRKKNSFNICVMLFLSALVLACTSPLASGTGSVPPPAGSGQHPPAGPEDTDEGIFVSPEGSNSSGDGSLQLPYQTIQYVLDNVAQSGDTLILRGGTYPEEVRIREPNITIRSRAGEWGIISLAPSMDPDNSPVGVLFDVESDGSKLRGVEVIGGFYGIGLFSAWDWDETPLDNDTATDIVIEKCIIHHTGRDCIKLPAGCDNITIRECEIYNSGAAYPPGTPADDKNAEGIDVVNSDNLLVQDCHIHDTATTGVYFKGGSTGGIVERTLVENCGEMGIGVGFDTSPDFFDTAANPEYYENINGIVRNCVVINTQYAGIGLYASQNALVHNNTIVNAGRQGHSSIYFGLSYQDWEPAAGRPPSTNPTIVNNIVQQAASIDTPAVSIRYSDDLGGMSALEGNLLMNNNCYFKQGAGSTFTDSRPAAPLENGSFTGWQNHISAEAQSMEENPMLDNSYYLRESSPCRDSGTNTVPGGMSAVDKDGNTRIVNGTVDLGAYEWSN